MHATLAPMIDAALEQVAAPGERFWWTMTTSVIEGPAVQTALFLTSPSPVIGEAITTVTTLEPVQHVMNEGTTIVDVVRFLVEQVRTMRARILGLEPGNGNGIARIP